MVYSQHLICLLAVLSNLAGASFLRGAQESNGSASLEEAIDYDELDFATDDLMVLEAEEERQLDYRGRGHNHGLGGRFGFGQGGFGQDGYGNFAPTVGAGAFNGGGVGAYNYGGVGAYNYAAPYNSRGFYNGGANSYTYNTYPYSNSYNTYSYGNNQRSPYGYNSYNSYSSYNNNYYSPSYGYGYAPYFYGYEDNMYEANSFFV